VKSPARRTGKSPEKGAFRQKSLQRGGTRGGRAGGENFLNKTQIRTGPQKRGEEKRERQLGGENSEGCAF